MQLGKVQQGKMGGSSPMVPALVLGCVLVQGDLPGSPHCAVLEPGDFL